MRRLAVAAFVAALLGPVLAALIRRRRRSSASSTGSTRQAPERFADECEVCGDLATHELRVTLPPTGDMPRNTGGGTEMAATYCAEHAPDGAVAFPG